LEGYFSFELPTIIYIMITIICATHRPRNLTQKVVSKYATILEELGQEVKIFNMSELPQGFVFSDSFGGRTAETENIIDQKLIPAERFVIVAPEYNGSYPGVFKAFLDGVKPSIWKGKKAALVGVASGRAGNIRGLGHLTDVFHHLRIEVFSNQVPISQIEGLLNDNNELSDEATISNLRKQAQEFLSF
jgi:chromate reductase